MNDSGSPSVLDAAREYLKRGWYPVPIPAGTKKPVLKAWPKLRLRAEEIANSFQPNDNIGLILGEPSGWLINVDLDCDEARELADQYLPPTPAVTGRPSAPRSHRWYIAENVTTKKHQDPINRSMIVELRSTGTQTVVGPSIHPSGERYDILDGEPAHVSGPMLEACVSALADAVIKRRNPDQPKQTPQHNLPPPDDRPSHTSDVQSRAIAYLEKLPPAISGQGGHPATYTAAVALVHGFCIEPERALEILLACYNPRCEPEWTEKELAHKVHDAATKPHDKPYGWLRDAALPDRVEDPSVDISAIVKQAQPGNADRSPVEERIDPGPIPPELLRVPGFVSEVMDHCLETAPYPNQALAFCGALSLQAFLAGRKVRDQADNRTNIYLLGLAFSSVGKDWPRKINVRVAHHIGMANCVGESFASGEGIQDVMSVNPSMLFQTDEIDGLLQSINKAKDARHENLLNTLLKMYSSSNSVFPIRPKARQGQREIAGAIDQPCLVIFGTAIPTHYYGALTERLLTNGFFARTVIVESGKRSDGQEPKICELPPRILETAHWWSEFNPGTGNLQDWHPVPAIVEYTNDAQRLLIESRSECDAQYAQAEKRGDPVGTTVWGRVNEQTRKFALLYAISANHETPSIDVPAVVWATRFLRHQTERMLYMAQIHAAENPFHAECLKFLQKLRDAPNQTLSHSLALKRMKMDAQSFWKMVLTLGQQGDIEKVDVKTAGRTGLAYRLIPEVKEG